MLKKYKNNHGIIFEKYYFLISEDLKNEIVRFVWKASPPFCWKTILDFHNIFGFPPKNDANQEEGCNRVYWVCGITHTYSKFDSEPFRKSIVWTICPTPVLCVPGRGLSFWAPVKCFPCRRFFFFKSHVRFLKTFLFWNKIDPTRGLRSAAGW